MRLFTAVTPSPGLRGFLQALLEKAASAGADIRWVKPDQLHMTLQFFGEVPGDKLPSLREGLARAGRDWAPFEVGLGGLGAFPAMDRPKTLFVPILSGLEDLSSLAARVRSVGEGLDLDFKRETYHPHLTLGRVRSMKNIRPAVEALREGMGGWEGRQWVGDFVLVRSRLSQWGADHSLLDSYPLGKA